MDLFELRAQTPAQVPACRVESFACRLRLARQAVAAVLACSLLAACGGGAGPETPAPSRDAGAEADESVFDPLTSTLDRAEGVQDTVNQRAEELRRRLEEDER